MMGEKMSTNLKYEKLVKIIEGNYPNMKHLSIAEYDKIADEIKSGNAQAVERLYYYLLSTLKYAALIYSKTNLKQQYFADYLGEVSITLMEKYRRKSNDWFATYQSFSTANHRIAEYVLSNFIKEYSHDLTIKVDASQNATKLEKCQFEYLPEDIPDDSAKLLKDIAKDLLRDAIENTLSNLSDQRKSYIIKFFGLDGEEPMSLQDIATEQGTSREVVRKLVSKALTQLRHPQNAKKLRDFYEL